MIRKRLVTTFEGGKLLSGINKMADAVKSTLGPMGRTVLIQDEFGNVRSTKDGVTVARSIALEDPVEDVAARVLREVSSKTNDVVGDGTTTATVLAQGIINMGFTAIEMGLDPNSLKREIDEAVEVVCQKIDEMSIPVSLENSEILERVAVISANNDVKLGKLLSDAFVKVGPKGIVTVQEGKRTEDYFEHSDGYRFSRGYLSSSFVNNYKDKSCEYSGGVNILIVGEKIVSVDSLFNLLEKIHSGQIDKKPFLLICEDIDEKILSLLVLNKMKGNIDICVVKSPGVNLDRMDLLEDLAVIVGGTVINSERGFPLDKANWSYFGYADYVKITDKVTTIIGGQKEEKRFSEYINNLGSQSAAMDEEYRKKKIDERIAKLLGGIGIIYAGGVSEFEIKEKIDRIDDALHALQAALDEGIVPGGGATLIKCISSVHQDGPGANIVKSVLEKPLLQMLYNAGVEDADHPEYIIERVKTSNDTFGFNVLLKQYQDNMLQAGIIDAAKVVKATLRSAASVGGLFITTSYAIVNSEVKDENL